jgi:hypothetical protein
MTSVANGRIYRGADVVATDLETVTLDLLEANIKVRPESLWRNNM